MGWQQRVMLMNGELVPFADARIHPLSLAVTYACTVFEGLRKERHGKPAHKNTYVQWALDRIASQVAEFNKRLTE